MIPRGPGVVRVRQVFSLSITVADDAGALLVRSGLVSSNALDEARARVASLGGTLGEQLVSNGILTDDELTDFYRARLLVPQVNPNTLARLTPKVVATIPSDMAIELRAIPVSLDRDNNLTVAMSDPSDRHAVDEIAFFTGAYVVRAVATQMQIAWCLAHYYGHVTALGQRLLHASESSPIKAAISAAAQQPRIPRTKGLTGKVNAARHRAIAPITGPVDVIRPNSGELDLRPLAARADPTLDLATTPVDLGTTTPIDLGDTPIDLASMPPPSPAAPRPAAGSPPITAPRLGPAVLARPTPPSMPAAVPTPRHTPPTAPSTAPLPPSIRTPALPGSGPVRIPVTAGDAAPAAASAPPAAPPSAPPAAGLVPRAAPDAPTLPPFNAAPPAPPAGEPEPPSPTDGAPDRPRARSVSGEIRVPVRRAASIRPPMPEPEDDDDEPVIVIERATTEEEATGPRKMPPRRRAVKSDPPELYARAGEVDLKTGDDRAIDADEPRIVIDEDALAPATQRIDTRRDAAPPTMMDVLDDADTGAVIHDRVVDHGSQPILLDRPRATPSPFRATVAGVSTTPLPKPDYSDMRPDSEDADTGEIVVVLDAKKPRPRPERRTQVGIPPAPVVGRPHRDTEASGIPTMLDHRELDRTVEVIEDPTTIDLRAAPPRDDTTSDQLAAPPAPARDDDTNPHLVAPPPRPVPARSAAIQAAVIVEEEEEEEEEEANRDADIDVDTGELPGPRTSVMSSVELDNAIPERTAEVEPGHLARRRFDYDPMDDGWGPPGTTIPPPLLGAIPGSEDDEAPSVIPMPSVDSSPLLVGPPPSHATGESGGRALARALEDATARAIEVIRQLEHAQSRDEVVDMMIAHLSETHHRAGFFVTRHGSSKNVTELGLFSMIPKPEVTPFATLRLDRPSTLQDVVGTRLPYRGPMHDDASRSFLISVLGACPPEILLVPVAVRERVVGVLFGEHRQRHTFDDQLALAARAAGMALERILKAKRG
jgi:type II secretion system (T2SS) protein E